MRRGKASWLRHRFAAWMLGSLLAVATPVAAEAGRHVASGQPPSAKRLATTLLLDAARAGSRLVAVGERGTIVYSDDDGAHWFTAAHSGQATLTAVQFVDPSQGWAVGHDALVIHTADGGLTWRQQYANPDQQAPLLGLRMRNRLEGIAVGAHGTVLHTDDGGLHWRPLVLGADDRHLYGLAWLDHRRLVVVGESGLIALSADAGRQWRIVPSPYAGSLFGLLALSDRVLIAFGMRGRILRTADAGETWSEVASPTKFFLIGGDVATDGGVFLAGGGGTVLVSHDDGLSFSVVNTGTSRQYARVLAGRGDRMLLVGEHGPTMMSLPSR